MRVHVRVPATSANLGPGFDALGLALGLHNEVEAAEADGVSVRIEGEGAGSLPPGPDNVVARGVRLAFEAAGRPFEGVSLTCVNRIPTARGLGSSAAAWVGGLVAGNALLGGPLDRDALLALAVRAEGHPDNVAAALLGGLTVSCVDADRVIALTLPVPADVGWVVLIPTISSSTAEARAVLPASVPLGKKLFIEFFMNPQGTSELGLDAPHLIARKEIGIDGRVEMELPAGVPLFEVIRHEDGRIAVGRDGQVFHVGGHNFGVAETEGRCVGCHAGHTLVEVPADPSWLNVAPSALIEASSTGK